VDSYNYELINQNLVNHTFTTFVEYYKNRPALVTQTLNDLPRMEFLVFQNDHPVCSAVHYGVDNINGQKTWLYSSSSIAD
jgi:hypothetical protein